MSYLKTLRTVYAHAIPELEAIYDECKFDNKDLSLNELIIQFHFSHLKELGKLTAKNMMRNLPAKYHWIARKFLKHEVMRIISVRWKPACDQIRVALASNESNEHQIRDYIQLHSPVRRLVSV